MLPPATKLKDFWCEICHVHIRTSSDRHQKETTAKGMRRTCCKNAHKCAGFLAASPAWGRIFMRFSVIQSQKNAPWTLNRYDVSCILYTICCLKKSSDHLGGWNNLIISLKWYCFNNHSFISFPYILHIPLDCCLHLNLKPDGLQPLEDWLAHSWSN